MKALYRDSREEKTDFRTLWDNVGQATAVLRALANENRLMILCLLAEGEKSVSELEAMTGARQPTVSQQLARLRADGLVESRREGKTIFYSLANDRARRILEFLDEEYRFADPAYSDSLPLGRASIPRR
jgi:DNA-binding transcriptional ArsR family regulator